MHNGKDNRLTSTFLTTCLFKALDMVEKDWRTANGEASGGPGALVISGKQDQEKFFSNGALRVAESSEEAVTNASSQVSTSNR